MIRARKIISRVTLWLGVVLALVGLGAAIWAGWISYTQWLALNALRSSPVDTATLQLPERPAPQSCQTFSRL